MRKILYAIFIVLLAASYSHAQIFGGGSGSTTGMAADGSVAWTGAPVPDSAGGQTIGSTSAEWGHIYLHNSKSIYFQADQSLYLTGGAGALTLTGGNFVPGAATLTLGSTTAEWGGLYLGDAKSIYFQADQSVYLTSGAGTLTLAGGNLALGANSLTMTGSIAATGNRVTKGWFTDIESTNAPTVGGVAYKPADLAIASQAGGDILYFNGTNWVRLAKDEGKYLKSGAAAVSWDSPAGSGDVESVGDCTSGACYDGSSDGGTYIRLYDGNSHYTQLQAGDSSGNLTFLLPTTAMSRGSLMIGSSTENNLGWLAIGTTGKILTTDGTDPSWSAYTVAAPGAAGAVLYSDGTNWTRSATLSVTLDNAAAQFADSSVATKKMKIDPVGMTAGKTLTLKGSFDQSTTIDFVNTALSADDKTLTFAVPITDNATYTFPAATATLAILGANTFTALQTYDATAGIQVGATGVGITSDDDGAITFTGKSAGYDEDLTLNFDDTENTVVVSSSTGVTKIDFSALNLATTGIITGAVNTNSDANGMSSSEMTAAGMYGTMFWATGAGTWNLPGAATGMSFCVYSTTAAAIVINPDDGDTIVLNGTALSAGDSITSASGAGDFICLLAKDANTWYTLGRSGTWTDTN